MPPILGCIADDFTGATDLAGVLVSKGMRAIVVLGVQAAISTDDTDAIVVALKSRTAPVDMAVQTSLQALRWLTKLGCRQFYFKYCSTFDSTPQGNIGPVIDMLMQETGADFTLACPAFPATGRTVYKSNLFVGDVPLSESSMRHHPLTPMLDSNLVRLLVPQTKQKVGKISYPVIGSGVTAIVDTMRSLQEAGVRIAVVDALSDEDLRDIAQASHQLVLHTGASGLAQGIAVELLESTATLHRSGPSRLPHVEGFAAILSGSCSAATLRQVAEARQHMPVYHFDANIATANPNLSQDLVAWARDYLDEGVVLISSSSDASTVAKVQQQFGTASAGEIVEDVLANTAVKLVSSGVRKLIVAGGETSGAVVKALNIQCLRIGPQIDPGVNWAFGVTENGIGLVLALKSGNFGADDFFTKAWGIPI